MAADTARGALFRPIVPNQHSRDHAEPPISSSPRSRRSAHVLGNPTPLGAVHVTLLFPAVWWVWVYTSWITNWLIPKRPRSGCFCFR
jgi:hypothetical protein